MKYTVIVEKLIEYIYELEASSPEEAEQNVMSLYLVHSAVINEKTKVIKESLLDGNFNDS